MNDELVYALIALGAHWWIGYKGAQTIMRKDPVEWDGLDMQIALCFAVFISGAILGFLSVMAYYVAPRVSAWYDAGGRIFKTDEEE